MLIHRAMTISLTRTPVSFTVRKATVEAFRQKHQRYGELSRVMRELLEAYVEGRVVVKPKGVLKAS